MWLNQGSPLARTEAIAAEIAADPAGHAFDRARYPVLFIYRQSHDQEIYFAVARALRGLSYDRKALTDRGATTFAQAPEADGRWHRPYTDVPFEYPALLLPFLLAPSYAASTLEGYGRALGVVMAACLIGAAWIALRARGGGASRDGGAWWTLSALLLAQGALAIQKLDAVPALFVTASLGALCARRPALAGAALGLATAAKIVPGLLLVPLVAADLSMWRERRAVVRGALGFGGSLALALVPMIFPPAGLAQVLAYHGERGLQIESTWGTLLAAWRVVIGTATPSEHSFGSFNLEGGAAPVLARLAGPASIVAMLVIAVWLARGPRPATEDGRKERLTLALLLSLAALWLTTKVFSPQYMTWALPGLLAVSPPLGKRLAWVLGAAMALTQLYVRGYYDYVTDLRPLGVVTLLARLALLAAFVVVLVRGLRAIPREPAAS